MVTCLVVRGMVAADEHFPDGCAARPRR